MFTLNRIAFGLTSIPDGAFVHTWYGGFASGFGSVGKVDQASHLKDVSAALRRSEEWHLLRLK